MSAKFKTKEILLAYLAGLVDGEGCILIKKRLPTPKNRIKAPKYSVSFSIAMTDVEPVALLAEYCGAENLIAKRIRRDGYKAIYQFDIENERALAFIRDIQPYLVCKSDQAEIAIAMGELKSTSRRLRSMGLSDEFISSCESFYQRIKKNNTRTGQPGRFGSRTC